MRYQSKKTVLLLLAVGLLSFTACSDTWDDHYDRSSNLSSHNLYETLSSDSSTTKFISLAVKAGYGDLLKSSQTYTVFAPVNAALSGLENFDSASLRRIISNHIARYKNPSSTPVTAGVRMINGKIYYFTNNSSFQGRTLISSDELATNGIIHHLNSQIGYEYNLYEYIENNPNTSKLYQFIHRFDESKFDVENSTEIDIDEQGRPVYDTVMVNYNALLEDKLYGIGNISKEDSDYTMLMPDNTAWDAAYSRLYPYFAVYSKDQNYADSLQDLRTCLAIVSDLVYRGKISAPASEDSLISTSGSIIHLPSNLFGNATKTKGSNGYMFVTSDLKYNDAETWNKPISVEAEQQNGRTYNNTLTSVYTRTVSKESAVGGVSGDTYIEVMPISTATNPTVIFDISNVLAGAYNIYAVFLPTTVVGAEETQDSTRIGFSLSYQNMKGQSMTKNNRDKSLVTKGGETVKMLAFENFVFPASNYTDNLWRADENNNESDIVTTTKLSVATNVSATEFSKKTFARSFRLDRIILEPVSNN